MVIEQGEEQASLGDFNVLPPFIVQRIGQIRNHPGALTGHAERPSFGIGRQQPITTARVEVGAVTPMGFTPLGGLLPESVFSWVKRDDVAPRWIKSGSGATGKTNAVFKEEGLRTLAAETSHGNVVWKLKRAPPTFMEGR